MLGWRSLVQRASLEKLFFWKKKTLEKKRRKKACSSPEEREFKTQGGKIPSLPSYPPSDGNAMKISLPAPHNGAKNMIEVEQKAEITGEKFAFLMRAMKGMFVRTQREKDTYYYPPHRDYVMMPGGREFL